MEDFEEEQAFIKKMKPFLRFKTGDVVFLKSDIKRTRPLNVKKLLPLSRDEDYSVFNLDDTGQFNIFPVFDVNLTA